MQSGATSQLSGSFHSDSGPPPELHVLLINEDHAELRQTFLADSTQLVGYYICRSCTIFLK